ncbi:DUF6708 domain-containing protein [Cupriavidus taiwanensis]|uniref:DUF6708 domain-containing protein n=1 Tax=Cupriavidus taiwanensis TaxID=164546 RepID=UPI000E15DAB3|nr:DUF6708 domain-containing protein [Cupriavidus taiwanensis]SOZ31428.1 conserved membrane hypothetical protein [Cupriavidus taiwanensis]SPA35900.1 conserved membrane hypothetical protein [Cupriavidus taiwanensis]
MTAKRSRLEPQSPYWYEDLPERTFCLENDVPDVGEDLLHLDGHFLELSRGSSMQRGAGLLIGGGMLIGIAYAAKFIFSLLTEDVSEAPVLTAIFGCGLLAFLILIIYVIKKDLCTPRDLPVRFYRNTGRIMSLEYVPKFNPFAKWEVVQRELDWHNLSAEMAKMVGYTGKVYAVRYSLIIAECHPGTDKVKQRIVLKADEIFPIALHRMWAFVRCYMINGKAGLQVGRRSKGISFSRCLLRYYPVLDFTVQGRERRGKLHVTALLYNAVVFIPLFWLFLPLSFCEFVALKVAPEPRWPNPAMGQR